MTFSRLWQLNLSISELWQIPSETSKVLWIQESPVPLADMPKDGNHKLGMGSGVWVDAAWLSNSSAALGAGVHSTWREVSAPGTDSASAEFLSACSATGLEKKNYLFHTAS